MAINRSEMLASLQPTILDMAPGEGVLTALEDVPHARDPHHMPVYELQVWDAELEDWVQDFGSDNMGVDEMVNEAHYGFDGPYRLLEDGLPVFIRG